MPVPEALPSGTIESPRIPQAERAYVVLARKRDNRLQFLLSRINKAETVWTFSGGGKKANENTDMTAARELMEETGIEVDPLKLSHVVTAPIRVNQNAPQSLHLFIAIENSETPFPNPQVVHDEKLGFAEMAEHVWMDIPDVAEIVCSNQILLPRYMEPALTFILLQLEATEFITPQEYETYANSFALKSRRGRYDSEQLTQSQNIDPQNPQDPGQYTF